jgi:broad specificity phosphatase PhoE
MIIHLVRHGQTQVGDDGLYIPNAGLTELGLRQADRLADRLAELNPQASVSSNLPRPSKRPPVSRAFPNTHCTKLPP